jgi:hypothetical protein
MQHGHHRHHQHGALRRDAPAGHQGIQSRDRHRQHPRRRGGRQGMHPALPARPHAAHGERHQPAHHGDVGAADAHRMGHTGAPKDVPVRTLDGRLVSHGQAHQHPCGATFAHTRLDGLAHPLPKAVDEPELPPARLTHFRRWGHPVAHAAGGSDALLEHATCGVESTGVGQAIGLMQAHVQGPHLSCGHRGHAGLCVGVQANVFGQACARRRGGRLQQACIKAPGATGQGLRQARHPHAHRHLIPAGGPDLGGALLGPPTCAAPCQQHHHRTPQPTPPGGGATLSLPQQERHTQAQRRSTSVPR